MRPNKFITTDNLTAPANPLYIKYLLEINAPDDLKEAMHLVMSDYKGSVNPALVENLVNFYFQEQETDE
jgi:hypothetical protein|tara:strand:+ start:3550 stop:3756 length:207 start_codon:yes stop_codon:yes gene_type:complete